MPLRLGTSRDLVNELPRVGAMIAALAATLAFEHFVVHELIVLPELAASGEAPLWTIAAMSLPELVVFFAVGYGVRSAVGAVMHAGVGAVVRTAFHSFLAVTGQAGHAETALGGGADLAVATPVMAFAYLLVLALAASAAADQREVVGDSG